MKIPSISLTTWSLTNDGYIYRNSRVGVETSSPGGLIGLGSSSIYLTTNDDSNLIFADAVEGEVSLSQLVSANATATDIEITVDPSDPNAPSTPTSGEVVFYNQTVVDNWLASKPGSPTVFALASDFFDNLPEHIYHDITINFVDGYHLGVLDFTRKIWKEETNFNLNGSSNTDNWTEIHAGGTVTGYQVANDSPYLQFSSGTFPNDGSLKGNFVVTSNNFVSVIWDHDDSILYTTNAISPTPTIGTTTASVKRPSTIFYNSSSANYIFYIDVTNKYSYVNVNDIYFKGDSVHDSCIIINNGFVSPTKCMFILRGADAGAAFKCNDVYANAMYLQQCSIMGDKYPGADYVCQLGGSENGAYFYYSYINGTEAGVVAQDTSIVVLSYSVFDSVGDTNTHGDAPGSINLEGNNSLLQIFDYPTNGGVRSRFINNIADVPCIRIENQSKISTAENYSSPLFYNNASPLIKIGISVNLDLTNFTPTDGFFDGGGNTDVGFYLTGPYSNVVIDASSNITGDNGDVKIEDAGIYTYEFLETKLTDLVNFNTIKKLT